VTFPIMPRPCDANDQHGACPFRLDAEAEEFEAARFEQLAAMVGTPEHDVPVDGNVFACHKGGGRKPRRQVVAGREVEFSDGRDLACAGAARVGGGMHVRMRLLVATGALPAAALMRQPDEPELFGTYDEMAQQQARGIYRRHAADVWRARAGWGPLAGRIEHDRYQACTVAADEPLDVETRGSAGPDTVRALS
jgi:hypothetical protein